MKLTPVLFVFAALTISFAASAQSGGRPQIPPGSIPGHDQIPGGHCFPGDRSPLCDPWGNNDPWGHGRPPRGGGSASCAPQVVESNVKATEKTLSKLAATRAFANATAFKSSLKSIAALKSQDAKAARYFALIGVDSRDANAVAEFVGAREVKNDWIVSLERSTALSDKQADTVAAQLQKTLRGDLK